MKIIQSFWTGNKINKDKSFGWLSSKYHYLGWILSANQLRKFYDDVTLYTDEKGYKILIEKLKLPYSSVEVVLDSLNNYNEDLWALSKIKTYSLNTSPFLHVDGDVFIWKEFNEELLNKPLIAQNIETTTEYYWKMWNQIRPFLSYIPKEIHFFDNQLHNKAFNMGIFGGNDIEFISKYCHRSFEFVDKNKDSLPVGTSFNFNIFFEQVLLYEMALKNNKKVSFLINENIGDNEYKGFGNFEEIPEDRTYLHLLGFFKRQHLVCNKLDIYVQKYYPEHYYHIENLLELNPKLSSFGFDYSRSSAEKMKEDYMNSIVKKTKIEEFSQAIYCRNIISEGKVSFFLKLIETGEEFYLSPLSNYTVQEELGKIEVELLGSHYLSIPMMNIDYIIFGIVSDIVSNIDFKRMAIDYLDEEFPENEIDNFIELLWKRISIFISNAVLYPMSTEEYRLRMASSQKDIKNYKQEEVDAGN